MKNKIKVGILTLLCIFAIACGNNSGQSGKVLFESSDKKIKVYEKNIYKFSMAGGYTKYGPRLLKSLRTPSSCQCIPFFWSLAFTS